MPLTDKTDTIGQGISQDPLQQFFGDTKKTDSGVIFVAPRTTGIIALLAALIMGAMGVVARALSSK